jgi:hypothetical protein
MNTSQIAFYKRFLMARASFQPADFGIEMAKEDFIDQLVDDFNDAYRGGWSVDEMLLHPREAMNFCDLVRRKHGYYDLPDDIILRVVMQRRKNPTA